MSQQSHDIPPKKKSSDKSTYSKEASGNITPDHPKSVELSPGYANREETAPEDFESDIRQLIADLKATLGEGESRWYYDELSETLYVELESITGLSEEEIEHKAGPVLDECIVDFEEIILLPFTS